MTKEQKEVLQAWCNNLLVSYRIDYFRGRSICAIMDVIECGSSWNSYVARLYCQEAKLIDFSPDTKDYTELLRELSQIEKEVPLSDAAYQAIMHVFGGYWAEAIEALDKLRSERNKQN